MDVVETIQSLAGELYADPSEIFELIKETPELKTAVQDFLRGDVEYTNLLELVSANC